MLSNSNGINIKYAFWKTRRLTGWCKELHLWAMFENFQELFPDCKGSGWQAQWKIDFVLTLFRHFHTIYKKESPKALISFVAFHYCHLRLSSCFHSFKIPYRTAKPRAHHHHSWCRTSPFAPSTKSCNTTAEAAGHKWWRQNSQILQNLIITLMKLLTSAFPPFRELHFVMKNEINPDCRVTARCLVSLQSSTRVAEKGCETQGVPPAEAVHKAKQPEIRNYLC